MQMTCSRGSTLYTGPGWDTLTQVIVSQVKVSPGTRYRGGQDKLLHRVGLSSEYVVVSECVHRCPITD